MVRIGRRGRLWLKGFHELLFILWIGGGVGEITIRLLTGSANSGTQLQAFYLASESLDTFVIPCAVLTCITGLLLTWLGGWGFRHFFVLYSLGIMIIAMVLGIAIITPHENTLVNLSDTLGLQALQNPYYQQTIQLLNAEGIIQVVLLISVAFVSIFKPLKNLMSATKRAAVSENIA